MRRSWKAGLTVIGATAVTLPLLVTVVLPSGATPRTRPGVRMKQLAELKGHDTLAGDDFGDVAISGTTIIAGAPGHDEEAGRAYVFVESRGRWKQVAELKGTNTVSGDNFGSSVAVSGGTAVVGAPGHDGDAGTAYVFSKTASGWKQATELSASGSGSGTDDAFGSSVALSGATIVVGAPGTDKDAGKAYVFTKTASGRKQVAELSGADTVAGDCFGLSVAISGTTIVAGAYGHAESGRAYVFAESRGRWGQRAELKGDNSIDAYFGYAVALSGTTALVGAPGQGNDSGRAYVYGEKAGHWDLAGELEGSDTGDFDNYFGASVALSGTLAVLGAPGHAGDAGRAYVFDQSGAVWAQTSELEGSDTAVNDFFGGEVALAGTTAVVGAPNHANVAGRAYVFGAGPASAATAGGAASPLGASVRVPGAGGMTGGPIHLLTPPSRAHPLRIILFGDSVMRGDAPAITAALESTGVVQVDDAGFDGWGLTTDTGWRKGVPATIKSDHPQLVIAMWSYDGPFLMQHPTEYRDWLSEFVRLVVAQSGVAGLMFQEFPQLGPPPVANPIQGAADGAARDIAIDAWDSLAKSLVGLAGTHAMYLPLGPAVERAGRFQSWLPPGDKWSLPASKWVRVRNIDGVHFCQAGAARYASALLADLTSLYHLPPPAPNWQTGSWTQSINYQGCNQSPPAPISDGGT